ncbi:MAG: elongation factor P [Candidatus Blackburnbacteria bacterium]|nr:elongation factor P [Candidatus Blackburnbacteria bacterium]
MIPVTELRAGATFEISGTPYQVTKYEHVKVGRGNATIRITARNLKTGGSEQMSFNSGATVEPILTTKRQLQYLYSAAHHADSANVVFMDPKTYEQVEVGKRVLGDAVLFLQEGQSVNVLFWDDNALSVDIPPSVVLTVAETGPGVKGNSATNIYKPATLENGLTVKVPLFINTGDKVKVDTRTGEYVERVSG